jgi:hypothetical protein
MILNDAPEILEGMISEPYSVFIPALNYSIRLVLWDAYFGCAQEVGHIA